MSKQNPIEQCKRYLIEALHCLNTYPIPTTRDLAATILWMGRATYELGKADPNDEALDIAEKILKEIIAEKKEV